MDRGTSACARTDRRRELAIGLASAARHRRDRRARRRAIGPDGDRCSRWWLTSAPEIGRRGSASYPGLTPASSSESYPRCVSEWPFWRRTVDKAAAGRPHVVDVLIAVGFGAVRPRRVLHRRAHAPRPGEPDVLGAVLILVACGRAGVPPAVAGGGVTWWRRDGPDVAPARLPDGGLPFAVVIALYTLASLCDRWVIVTATAVVARHRPPFVLGDGHGRRQRDARRHARRVRPRRGVGRSARRCGTPTTSSSRSGRPRRSGSGSSRRAAGRGRRAAAHRPGAARRAGPRHERGGGAVGCRRPCDRQPPRRGQTHPPDDQRDEPREHDRRCAACSTCSATTRSCTPTSWRRRPGSEQLDDLVGRVTEAGVPVDAGGRGRARGACPPASTSPPTASRRRR